MTVAIAIVGIVATLVAAFGGAWHGGRLQRSSNTETLALQFQIDAAAKFLAAVEDATLTYVQSFKPGTEDLAMRDRAEAGRIAFADLAARVAAIEIVGPDLLADIAQDVQALANLANYHYGTSQPAGVMNTRNDMQLLAKGFEREARNLLRPNSRQKNGRRRGALDQQK